MGRKTTRFITDLEKLHTECKSYMEQFITNQEQLAEMDRAQYDTEEKCKARVNQILQENGNDEKAARHIASADPEVKKLSKQLEQFDKMARKAVNQRRKIKEEVYNRLARIERKLNSFQQFIDKKTNSKHPFKSKKSLPAARDFIAASREFHANTEHFFKSVMHGLDWN